MKMHAVFFSPLIRSKKAGEVQYFFCRLHRHSGSGDPCSVIQARPVTIGNLRGGWGQGLDQLLFANPDASIQLWLADCQ